MKTFIYVLKSILKAFFVWLGLTIVALTIDSIFHLSEKSEGFTFIFILVPLICAIWGPAKSLIAWALSVEHRTQKPQKPSVSSSPPSANRSQQNLPQQPCRSTTMSRIDRMEGHAFEEFVADLLRKLGYERVKVTPGSGDQGVDVIAVKDGKKYAIQCKRYSQKLGNKPVQEVYAGKTIYGCNVAVVITNNYFTDGAKEAARATGVELWDRDWITSLLEELDASSFPI